MNILNRELIRHILGSLGLVPPPNFGKVGITTLEFKLDKTISMQFEGADGKDKETEFVIWSGSTSIAGSKLKVLATDICDNENSYHEFVVVYRLDEAPIHGIKHIFYDNDFGLFLSKQDKEWKAVGTYQKLISCAGFEKINQVGMNWVEEDHYEELYQSLVEMVEM